MPVANVQSQVGFHLLAILMKIKYLIAGLLIGPILGNLFAVLLLKLLVVSGVWYEDKIAKVELINTKSLDVAFIGSSHIQYHIDTGVFQRNGVRAFNYGVINHEWEDYPYMVSAASEKAKNVAITVEYWFLNDDVPCPTHPAFEDLIFFVKFKPACLLEMKLDKYIQLYIPQRGFWTSPIPLQTNRVAARQRISDDYKYDLAQDARGINSIKETPGRNIVTFSNGDGVLFGDISEFSRNHPERLSEAFTFKKTPAFDAIKSEPLAYLKLLTKSIQNQGRQAIVIFNTPVENFDPELSRKLQQELNVPVIDLGGKLGELAKHKEYWADGGHLNYTGVQIHSLNLYNEVAPILEPSRKQ